MSEEAVLPEAPQYNERDLDSLDISDEFKTFLMSHKEEVMRLLKDTSAASSKEPSEMSEKKFKDSSSESESSMPRRRRDSASSDCSSESGGEERRAAKRSRRDSTRSRSRSRSQSPPVRCSSRRAQRERSDSRDESRSRSRSRSSTPARYERHLRRESGRDHASPPARRRGYYRGGRGRGGHHHYSSSHHSSHHHHHSSSSHRGEERDYQNYETGARRGGFIRSRNALEDGRDNPVPSECLGIFGMPPWIREYDMRNMFEPYGEIVQLNVVINRYTGQCRGYGFVYYSSVEEAKRARVAMKDAKIDGIPIRVDFSVTDQRRRSYRD
ncbi:hypothetical protein PMAYCL1PPCAC_03635 [Pristionchus mayeri]|uniref:RRM domain-containing protein n=1 Tax=Pristionchus mayeri TaxID=1317129 RepID=A0AAN5C7C7_9BILA|nr:hypothetical protein PMAYCL1PPCAC_03635 [Pristionchus mayeri]